MLFVEPFRVVRTLARDDVFFLAVQVVAGFLFSLLFPAVVFRRSLHALLMLPFLIAQTIGYLLRLITGAV